MLCMLGEYHINAMKVVSPDRKMVCKNTFFRTAVPEAAEHHRRPSTATHTERYPFPLDIGLQGLVMGAVV